MNELNDMKDITENILEFKNNNDIKDISNSIKRFNYRGVDCEIMLNDNLNIYCGYLKLKEVDEVIHEACNELFHGGITWESKDNKDNHILGFDCGHASDIVPLKAQDEYNLYYRYDLDLFKMMTFKTDGYAKDVLEKTIDYLIDNILINELEE